MRITKFFGAALLSATAIAAGGLTPSSAQAHYNGGKHLHKPVHKISYNGGYNRGYNGYRGRDYRRAERRYDRRDYRRSYRERNYRSRRCDNGTGGTVIGAIAGGLLGNEVAGYGDKAVGTVIGAAVGAVAGRAIDKADDPCKRRRYRR